MVSVTNGSSTSDGALALKLWPIASSIIAAIVAGMLVYAGVERDLATVSQENAAIRSALVSHEQMQAEQQKQIRDYLSYIRARVDRLTELQQQKTGK